MNLAVAGVFTWGIAAGLALADGLDATTQVSQAVEQYRTLAPRFGQPTVVTTSANTTAATLATQLRSVLNQRAPGTFQPAPAPLTASSPQTSPTATNLRQRDALARLSETTDSSLLIQLRPENQTIRQIRATDLLNPTLRSRARPAGGGAPAKESLARTFLNQHRAAFQLEDPDTELITVAVEDDLLGHTHVRFQQQHQGHEVALARLTAHFHPDGRLELLDGAYIPTPQDVPVAPTVADADALLVARASIPGGFRGTAGAARTVIHAPLDGAARLAWEFEIAVGLAQAWQFTVDAVDGRILSRRSRVYDVAATGSGVDLSGTSRALNLWRVGATYTLADTSKQMFNAAGDPLSDPKGVITVLDARGTGINSLDDNTVFAITSSNPNQWSVPGGISAAFNFAQTYDYYLERHGRNSINGSGGNVTAVVGVGGYDNASWHGNLGMMFFGNVRKYPGSLDVVAHELTHGVTENSANLVYEMQSGALNEAFSDIFGECVEARTRTKNDWKMGTDLGEVFRDLKNPHSITIGGLNRPYPARFSELIKLANTPDADNGGVHLNSSIINHTFYQLAEGLTGAIGIPDAEKIFYRCLTRHLQARSQFLDCRLGCLAAAEALFGPGSNQVAKTAEAFDLTEIFAGPTAPKPVPLPAVNAPDSLMFVYFDPSERIFNLGRREAALNDDATLGNFRFSFDVRPTRPSLTGDGELVIYVDSLKTVCLATTAPPAKEQCVLSTRGSVHSIALSPDASRGAFVPINPQTGEPLGQIVVFGVLDETLPTRTYDLVAPGLDGASVDQVLNADSMTFSTDGHELVYDARSRIRFNGRPAVESWSLYNLNLDTDRTAILVPPLEEFDTGNPTVGRVGTRYVAFDASRRADGENAVLVLDTFTGEVGSVAANGKVLGYPAFTGDEGKVLYSQADGSASGSSLMLQSLAADRLSSTGQPGLFYADATLGALYRRGAFVGQNAAPTISLAASRTNAPAPTPVTLTATAQDSDGSVVRVEYYDGPTKLGESTAAPHRYVWNAPALGDHRVVARAIDNLGATTDSSLLRIVIGATTTARLAASLGANNSLRLTLTTAPGTFTVQQSADLRTWLDVQAMTVGADGTGSVDVTGGATTPPARFFRVRR